MRQGLTVPDEHTFPEPHILVRLDTNAWRHEFRGRLLDCGYPFDLDVLVRPAKKLIERSNVFNADAGGSESATNRPTPRRARVRPSSSSNISASRITVRLTSIMLPSSVSVGGSREPGGRILVRIASAMRE